MISAGKEHNVQHTKNGKPKDNSSYTLVNCVMVYLNIDICFKRFL